MFHLDLTQSLGFQVVAIAETHVHADCVSGARELDECSAAPIYASRLGDQVFLHRRDDGEELPVGRLAVRAHSTPGHCPRLLFNVATGAEPHAPISGDVLFVGVVGRPDLLGEPSSVGLARHVYVSGVIRLASLPNGLIVFPGLGAGSSCGRSIPSSPTTSIGQARRFSYTLQPHTPDEFVGVVLEHMPTPPTYDPILERVNRVGPTLLRDRPHGHPLTATEVNRLSKTGDVLIDARLPRHSPVK